MALLYFVGKKILKLGKINTDHANDYVNGVSVPDSWIGTRADLEKKIAEQADACANYVHGKEWTTNRANARQMCKERLEKKYANLLNATIQQTAQEEALIKQKALEGNQKIYAVVAVVLLVLISIVIILKK